MARDGGCDGDSSGKQYTRLGNDRGSEVISERRTNRIGFRIQ